MSLFNYKANKENLKIMDICFNETPAMFGIFHIAMMVLSIVVVCVFVILVKNRAEDKHLNMTI